MLKFFKSIFNQLLNYGSYQNSKKLYKLMQNGNYHDALAFIDNHKFLINKPLIEQWVANVYMSSNGAPISQHASQFNKKFMSLTNTQENHEVIQDFIDSFNYSPAIEQINKYGITFRKEKGVNDVPFSEFNIKKVTHWLIAECTLNNFMEKYPHMITLLNQKFNEENVYTIPHNNVEIFKVFISVFYKEVQALAEKEKIKVQQETKSISPSYFDFSQDFTHLPIESQIILDNIQKTLDGWDWKTSLKYDSFTEESHQMDKILTHQIEFCIQQYTKMPVDFRTTMKNHEGFNMNELLESNLKDILSTVQTMKNQVVMNDAEQRLFNQTVQKTMLANQRN